MNFCIRGRELIKGTPRYVPWTYNSDSTSTSPLGYWELWHLYRLPSFLVGCVEKREPSWKYRVERNARCSPKGLENEIGQFFTFSDVNIAWHEFKSGRGTHFDLFGDFRSTGQRIIKTSLFLKWILVKAHAVKLIRALLICFGESTWANLMSHIFLMFL